MWPFKIPMKSAKSRKRYHLPVYVLLLSFIFCKNEYMKSFPSTALLLCFSIVSWEVTKLNFQFVPKQSWRGFSKHRLLTECFRFGDIKKTNFALGCHKIEVQNWLWLSNTLIVLPINKRNRYVVTNLDNVGNLLIHFTYKGVATQVGENKSTPRHLIQPPSCHGESFGPCAQ